MTTISNQKLSKGEQQLLGYISILPERSFYGSQQIIANEIGKSRAHTNVMIQRLVSLGLLHIYRSKNLNEKLRLITLEPIRKIEEQNG